MICCFYGVLLCKQHPRLTIEPLFIYKRYPFLSCRFPTRGILWGTKPRSGIAAICPKTHPAWHIFD